MKFADLVRVPTIDTLTDVFWSYASGRFDRTKIRASSPLSIIVNQMLTATRGLYQLISDISINLTNIHEAKGPWLRVIGAGFYGLEPNPERPTSGQITIVATTGTVANPTLVDPTTGVTFTSSGTATTLGTALTFTASRSGTVGNVPLAQLQPASPGVYSISSTDYSTAWIVSYGAGEESDSSYRQRCLDVISRQSAGVPSAVAAAIRSATNYQIQKVGVGPHNASPRLVWIAPAAGTTTDATLVSTAQTTANLYTSGSVSPLVSAATATKLKIVGTLWATKNTDVSVLSQIASGLESWINGLPISDGSSSTDLSIFSIMQQINVLDTTQKIATASIACYVNGTQFTGVNTVLPQSAGTVWLADLSGLKIAYGAR